MFPLNECPRFSNRKGVMRDLFCCKYQKSATNLMYHLNGILKLVDTLKVPGEAIRINLARS